MQYKRLMASPDTVQGQESALQALQAALHPQHYLILQAKRNLICIYGSESGYDEMSLEEMTKKLNLCDEWLGVVDKLGTVHDMYNNEKIIVFPSILGLTISTLFLYSTYFL